MSTYNQINECSLFFKKILDFIPWCQNMVSYTDCLPAPRPVLGSDATTRFVERRGTAYLPSCSGGDWGCVKEVSTLSPSHFMAQWSVGRGVMLAHMPGDDLKKVYKKVYLFLTTHTKWSLRKGDGKRRGYYLGSF